MCGRLPTTEPLGIKITKQRDAVTTGRFLVGSADDQTYAMEDRHPPVREVRAEEGWRLWPQRQRQPSAGLARGLCLIIGVSYQEPAGRHRVSLFRYLDAQRFSR